ncbi:carbohydrate ABC transporter permease [Metabacillus rhizolycopersici]|uniref:Carbohydrate ABC transporter permease n=1 Tax=Metabacillus rhizolycopersici TaxID=2875709 RepID=A0ABS7UXS9_9BACI|nr:carbohydrate ABC transporter permease [Metabacillus rhizolycopersici]MBZ5753126.1 carbohydrate ABC transporter permease [Metabacillus rhizolycopersici]
MRQGTNWPVTILISLGSLLIVIPLYMAISIALKTPQELAQSALSLPFGFHWENFTRAIEATNFFSALKNSAIITIFTLIFTILSNSLVAYAIARNMHRKFFKGVYFYFVSALFIPFPIIMLPVVKQTSALGLNNPVGLILLYVVYGMAMNIFIYVGYIRSIPKELEEAAIVDGCSTWGVFWKVIFPLLTPINATIGILTCLWAWNDFLLPLIILNDSADATLPLVQYVFQTEFGADYNLAFASYLLALAPMVIVYLFAQRWIIGGVVKGAIK